MSTPKETHFFSKHFDRGLGFYRDHFFKEWQGQGAVGEASPPYLFLPYVPERIAASIPEIKMVVILRNPAKRAFSHWWMNITFGIETLDFKDAVMRSLKLSAEDAARATMCERFYLQVGYYAEQMQRYWRLFPREQFHIIFSDDLKHNTEKTLRDIHRFIGVDPLGLPDDTVDRFETIGPFASKIRGGLRRLGMDNVIPAWAGYAARRLLMTAGDTPPKMDKEMMDWLTLHYRPYNRKLQELLEVDLSEWGA